MAKETLPVKKTDSIFDDLQKMHERVMRRAHELFEGRGKFLGKDLDDWLQAERELLWKPSIELREKDHEFLLDIAVPGMDAKDLNIEVTPEDLVVKAEIRRENKEDKGKVHTSELESGSLFRAIRFPKKVDSEKVTAEFKNGMLTVKAPIAAEQRARAVKIGA